MVDCRKGYVVHTNTLYVLRPLGETRTIRFSYRYKLQFMTSKLRVNIISRGDLLPSKHLWVKRRSRQNRIVVDTGVTRTEFMEKVRRYFADRFRVNPEYLQFQFDKEVPKNKLPLWYAKPELCLRFHREVMLQDEICLNTELHDELCKRECRNYPRRKETP